MAEAQSKSGYKIQGVKKNKPGRKSSSWMDKVFVQPNVGLSFQSNSQYSIFDLYLSPTIGYKIYEGLSAGIGPSYAYSRVKPVLGDKYSINALGANAFVRYAFSNNFFLMTQYETLGYKFPNESKRVNVDAWYAGGGFLQPIGKNAAFMIAALYDLTHDNNDPYAGSPISISTGIVFNAF
jgi:hypothetical protein